MANNHTITRERGVTIVRFESAPTFAQVRAAFDELAQLEGGDPLRLWDLTCGVRFSHHEVTSLARAGSRGPQPARSRVAIIADDDLSFGLSRMYGAYRVDTDVEHRVFRTEEEGMAWLLDATP